LAELRTKTGGEGPPRVLFTAFEPSGDDHASPVIEALLRLRPDVEVWAWGGSKMEIAGARLVQRTGEDAVVGMPGLAKIREHRRINARIGAWMDEHDLALHVPVDAPAANFPICAIAKARGARVVHLVAPQIWAWGSWRIRKLRRLTDLVLCLLPFEEGFFTTRGVPAKFIGHPLFDQPLVEADLERDAAGLPDGSPRIAIMPGSRPAELERNFPLLLETFRRVRSAHPGALGVVAAVDERARRELEELAAEVQGLRFVSGRTDGVIRWCELALVVSGTVTLQIARQKKPMVAVYRTNRVLYELVGRWVVSTPFFTLPNLIAGKEVIPEFVPHFGGVRPVAERALRLLESETAMNEQRRDLAEVAAKFRGKRAADAAAEAIVGMLERGGR